MVTNLQKTLDGLKKFVHEASLDVRYRARPQDFTRERLLPFHRVVSIILSAMKRPLDLELKMIFDLVDGLDCPTDSAFSQARKKLLSEFFVRWLEHQSELRRATNEAAFPRLFKDRYQRTADNDHRFVYFSAFEPEITAGAQDELARLSTWAEKSLFSGIFEPTQLALDPWVIVVLPRRAVFVMVRTRNADY